MDVGVLDLRFAREAGLDCGRAEVDALRSSVSGWSEVPLVNEDGGGLLGVLVMGFVGVVFTVFGGDFIATGDAGLTAGGATVGWGGVFGISAGSGVTGFGGSGSTRVDLRDGGRTSITFGGSAGGGGGSSTSGGAKSSKRLASGELVSFFNSGNGEVWIVGWIGCHRCPEEESPVFCALSRGGQSLPPTLPSPGEEVMLEVRGGGHSLFSFTSSLAESPVVCETTLELRGPGDDGGCFLVCCSNRPMRFATL